MKKKYLQPDMEIVELNTCQYLLTGSDVLSIDILVDEDPVPGDVVLSPLKILGIETGVPNM